MPTVTGVTRAFAPGSQRHYGGYDYHRRSILFHGYWDPCYPRTHYYYSHWNYGSHCGPFSWSLSLWYPFWYARYSLWDRCYGDTFWYSWSSPYCVSASYWWYPRSVYCPSYFYVPSTVVVIDRDADREPAPEPAPAGGGASTEIVVAGGGVVGSARAVEKKDGEEKPATTESLSTALAIKYVDLGDFYFRAERFGDAVEAYSKARSYAPDDASVHFVLADAVFAQGDYHYAAFLIGEGLRLDPGMAAADTDKRTFYTDAKTFDNQLAALDRYLEKNAYDAQAHLVRGYNLAFSKNPTQAIASFQRVLEIDAENRAARTFLDALAKKAAAAPTDR